MKRLSVWLAILAMVLALTACGAGNGGANGGNSAGYDNGMSMDASEEGWADTAAPADPGSGGVHTSEKKIYTGAIEAETKDFDAAHQAVTQAVAELGGYFERQSVSQPGGYRYGNYVIRVEAKNFAAFFDRVGDSCHVTYSERGEEDVTDAYYDVSARLETARTKLDRLQALLAQADNMADIITIESAISDTELTVEQLTGSLQGLEGRIQYAAITMNLREVDQLSDEEGPSVTFGGRLSQAFAGGLRGVVSALENLAVFLAYSWVWLLLLAGAVVAGVAVFRRRKRREKGGKLPPAE